MEIVGEFPDSGLLRRCPGAEEGVDIAAVAVAYVLFATLALVSSGCGT